MYFSFMEQFELADVQKVRAKLFQVILGSLFFLFWLGLLPSPGEVHLQISSYTLLVSFIINL
jgi:hypothetical protein